MDEQTTENKEIKRLEYKVVLVCQQPKCYLVFIGT